MFARVFVAFLFCVSASVASDARPIRTGLSPECNVTMPCDSSSSQIRQFQTQRLERSAFAMSSRSAAVQASAAPSQTVGGRPAGCPRSFCGCGAAIRVFGRIVPELNLAANWLRFPRPAPAPGMVAARRGHVFVLEQHVAGDTWMAYDANSGGRAIRIHARSLRGYSVVNPHVS